MFAKNFKYFEEKHSLECVFNGICVLTVLPNSSPKFISAEMVILAYMLIAVSH